MLRADDRDDAGHVPSLEANFTRRSSKANRLCCAISAKAAEIPPQHRRILIPTDSAVRVRPPQPRSRSLGQPTGRSWTASPATPDHCAVTVLRPVRARGGAIVAHAWFSLRYWQPQAVSRPVGLAPPLRAAFQKSGILHLSLRRTAPRGLCCQSTQSPVSLPKGAWWCSIPTCSTAVDRWPKAGSGGSPALRAMPVTSHDGAHLSR
jgi:hypothetical protein